MPLTIETSEADELARSLMQLTGETMIQTVTVALRERLERERARRETGADMPARVMALAERLRGAYDTRPITKAEWDAANGELG